MKTAGTKENTYPGIGWEEVYRTNGIFYSHDSWADPRPIEHHLELEAIAT